MMWNLPLHVCFALATSAGAVSLAKKMMGMSMPPDDYYWPHARGHPGHYSNTPYVAPSDLNATLAWSWHHPDGRYHTMVISAPVLDHEKNVYSASLEAVRKFTSDGDLLWQFETPGPVSFSITLMGGAVFGSTTNGYVFGLDMETGLPRWSHKKANAIPGDTGYVEAMDGIVFAGVDPDQLLSGGSRRILGLDATDGHTLWEYHTFSALWNFMPVFPGNGTFIAMGTNGLPEKVDMHTGTRLWVGQGAPLASLFSFSDGGVMLGMDGTAYTCSNYNNSGNKVSDKGALRAYRQEDGHMLWEQILQYPCNSWPAVTADDQSVIVTIGPFVATTASSDIDLLTRFNKDPLQMHEFSLSLGERELHAYGRPDIPAAVQSFNTRTGALQWSTDLPSYGRLTARGDEEGLLERRRLGIRDHCLPAQFGAPTISGDGTVYVGRADGKLYAVESGTGRYRTFNTEAGFLHPGTSWAPGMMAVSSCDGVFVWKW